MSFIVPKGNDTPTERMVRVVNSGEKMRTAGGSPKAATLFRLNGPGL